MREPRPDQAFELGNELVSALGRKVELEELDGYQPLARRIVRAKYRPQRSCANLKKNPKRSERIGRRSSSRVSVQ